MRGLKLVALLVLICLLFAACNIHTFSWHCQNNEEIPEKVMTQVQVAHEQAINTLKSGDKVAIATEYGYLFQNTENVDETVETFAELLGSPLSVYNQHYVTVETTGNLEKTVTITPWLGDELKYYFSIDPVAEEQYIIFSTTNKPHISYMLSSVYHLTENHWTLYRFYLSPYQFWEKDTEDYATMAKELYNEEKILPAKFMAYLSMLLLNPGDHIVFASENSIRSSNLEILNSDDLVLPSIDYNDRTLQIVGFDINPYLIDGFAIYVNYVTDTPFSNTNLLQQEAEYIVSVLDSYYPGMTDLFAHYACRAFNTDPADSQKSYSYYTSIVILGEQSPQI